MSRTDKTDPYWVKAMWWEPVHYCKGGQYSRYRIRRTDECDLPPEPIVSQFKKGWHKYQAQCFWEPVWDHTTKVYRYYGRTGVPKWYVDHVWWNPQRVKERVELREIAKDYNGNGDTELNMENDRPRNCAKWYYW